MAHDVACKATILVVFGGWGAASAYAVLRLSVGALVEGEFSQHGTTLQPCGREKQQR